MPKKDCKQDVLRFQFWKRERAGMDPSEAGWRLGECEAGLGLLDGRSLSPPVTVGMRLRAGHCVGAGYLEVGGSQGRGCEKPMAEKAGCYFMHSHARVLLSVCSVPGSRCKEHDSGQSKANPGRLRHLSPPLPFGDHQGLCSSHSDPMRLSHGP